MLQNQQKVQCPYCDAWIEILLDLSIESQSYVEDCHVCCHPMTVSYQAPGGALDTLTVESDEFT